MRLQSVTFNVDDEPETFIISASARDMTLLYGILGYITPKEITAASTIEWGNAFYDLTDELGSIGNRFYDAGWPCPAIGRALRGGRQ